MWPRGERVVQAYQLLYIFDETMGGYRKRFLNGKNGVRSHHHIQKSV